MDVKTPVATVTTREELIYLLTRASELEHGLACVYLFAAYSLKSNVAEGGLTAEQAETVRGWKRKIASVAVEEMLHLAQVSNLLTAIGGAPHFRRSNFPLPPTAFPFGLRLSLEPFSRELIERFVCYEMPEEGVLSAEQQRDFEPIRARVIALEGGRPAGDARDDGGAPIEPAAVAGCEPFEVDFTTVGEFYKKIESGFRSIPQDELFIGPPHAQADAEMLDLGGELMRVVDQASACAAIDMIIQQGEAPSSAHPDAHFCVFDSIRREYETLAGDAQRSGVAFHPVRPVAPNPMTRFYEDTSGGTLVTSEETHAVADLFNVAYDTMLLMLLRFFAHEGESEGDRAKLARATLRAMTTVLRPLGEALAKMPLERASPAGATAGPGFGYNRDVHLLPHRASAWIFFGERLRDLATRAVKLEKEPGLPEEFREASAALEDLAIRFAPANRAWNGKAERARFESLEPKHERGITPEPNGPYLVNGVEDLVNSLDEPLPARPAMALCRCGGSANKPFCDGTHARVGFTSDKKDGRVPDRLDRYEAPAITVEDNRGICQHAGFCTDDLPAVFHVKGEPFVTAESAPADDIVRQVRRCPSGALHASHNGEREPDVSRLPRISVSKDGPYRVTGGVPLHDTEFAQGQGTEHYALCRCGGSKNKPFCDGSHWYNNFKDDRN